MIRKMRKLISRLRRLPVSLRDFEQRLDRIQETLGRIESRHVRALSAPRLCDAEFRVYSQWGEDGIIQLLLKYVPIERRTFVEFGVENYRESNTRFLLMHDNWSGLVMDGDERNIDFIRRDAIFWRHNLKADCAFVTRENINELLRRNGLESDIGLLSIDIDGNDYWVWQAIDVVTPRIVIAEYNSRFGHDRSVTVPYRPDFTRHGAHPSMIYYGASLAALVRLGDRKGYDFVGSNSAGNNAFFVRRDVRPDSLPVLTAREGYVRSQFREMRDSAGELTFSSFEEEQALLNTLPLTEAP
ncbi:MAG: hypothetical protein ACREV5_14185 [Steroidobacter sp.]